jgi:putative endonuclease
MSEVTPISKPVKPYWLYLLECKGGSYYAGIALDVQERFEKHRAGTGAAYTRANKPLRVLASMVFPDKGSALKAEYAVKQIPKSKKLGFFGV